MTELSFFVCEINSNMNDAKLIYIYILYIYNMNKSTCLLCTKKVIQRGKSGQMNSFSYQMHIMCETTEVTIKELSPAQRLAALKLLV